MRKVLRCEATEFRYDREEQPLPRIGPWQEALDQLLRANEGRALRERLTLIRIFEALRGQGYEGGYDAVRRYARSTTVTVKVAHVRLCRSRMLFVRAYPRETQEMVFDAHDRAFAFFTGACARRIYDAMKTAVDVIFVGRERAYNRRFAQMCSHYLIDPVACTPASGWGEPRCAIGPSTEGERTHREPSWLGARAVLHAAIAGQKLRRGKNAFQNCFYKALRHINEQAIEVRA